MSRANGSLSNLAEVSTKPPGGLGTTSVIACSGKFCEKLRDQERLARNAIIKLRVISVNLFNGLARDLYLDKQFILDLIKQN